MGFVMHPLANPKILYSTILAFVLLLAASAGTARANPDAEKFADGLMQRGLAILRDNTGNDASRKARLHQLVLQSVDARKTALFALGNARRGLSPQAVETYVAAFTDYITTIYETRFEKYRELDVKVLSSIDNAPGDITVLTQGAIGKDKPGSKDPIIIGFRLNGANGNYKIVDVQIAGIWVSIDQRERFADMMSKNNNDIRALTAYLTGTTAQIKSGAKKV